MKATTVILAAVLTLMSNLLSAGNDSFSAPVSNESSPAAFSLLAPVTPSEAGFEDAVVVSDLTALMPVTPEEATFEDFAADAGADFHLAPLTPFVADFEDMPAISPDLSTLVPVVPAEADFE